jgi:hypothetical protein
VVSAGGAVEHVTCMGIELSVEPVVSMTLVVEGILVVMLTTGISAPHGFETPGKLIIWKVSVVPGEEEV